jgi:hypothetical protein
MDLKEKLQSKFKESEQVSPSRWYKFKREDLAKLLGEFGLHNGVEIGVAEGKFSEVLAKYGAKMTCVDTWGVGDDARSQQIGSNQAQQRYDEAVERLKPYECKLLRMKSMEAIPLIPDKSLDFVYIDGAHDFDYIMEDIIAWSRKVKPGGIVAGHDYYRFRNAGVIQAVDLYTHMHDIHQWFVTDERTPSFFWIK